MIDGKYQVVERLGEGFGGYVFLVEDRGKKVALKQLRMRNDHECLSAQELLDNFKQEFTTLKQLNHPHILRILDFGFDPKEQFHYFTTQYIRGQDIFTATRGLSPAEVEDLFVQVLRALSYLHSQKVFHLDIKPANILVEKSPEGRRVAKLIDFGLTAFRKKGVLAGSPAYLAPEALLGERLDGRADLYSLGVTWYKCLAGVNPFEGNDMQTTLNLQRLWMPPPVSSHSPNIPPFLDPILEKLLKKNPAERYHRADQVIRDLNWSGFQPYPLETEATALAYLPGEGKLVGRDAEWSQLLSFFGRIFSTPGGAKACVLISGESGTGKSRLLQELKYHAQIHTIPVQRFAEASPARLKSKCLLLEDDVDMPSLERAKTWMQQFHTHPFLIVLAGSQLPDLPGLGYKITLGKFDRPTVSQYIASVLGVENPPDFLVEELYLRSEGNPLFLTELLETLIQSQQIFDEQGRWSAGFLQEVGLDFNQLQVPKTLNEYCQKHYQRLSKAGKNILAALALAKAPLTREMVPKLELGVSREDWTQFQQENLLRVDPVEGEVQLLNPNFKNWIGKNLEAANLASINQALGSLFRQNQRTREAAWFHLGHGTEEKSVRVGYLLQYGESLLQRYRWLEAAQAFEAAALLSSNLEMRVDANLRKVQALFRTGQHAEATRLLEDTQNILKKERENPQQWRWVQHTLREMGSIYLKAGRLNLARESLQASKVLLEDHEEDPVEQMILENLKASVLMREGNLSEAAKLSEATFRRWNELPQEAKSRVLNCELPAIYHAQGKHAEAKELFQLCSSFCESVGHFPKMAYALYGWAECCSFLKEYPEAVRLYQRCIELSRKINNQELLFHAFNGLGNLAYKQKDWTQAAQHYQEALELAQHHADLDSSVAIAINLALVLELQGDFAGSRLYLRHVIETLEAQVPPSLYQLQFLSQAYLALGKVHVENFQWTEARDAFRDAARLVRHHPALDRFRFSALMGLFKAAFNLGRTAEAQTVLMEVEKGNLTPPERQGLEGAKRDFKPDKGAS